MQVLFFNISGSEIILILLVTLFPLFCIIDIIRSDFKDATHKILWILCVLVAPVLGSAIYLIYGRSQKVFN